MSRSVSGAIVLVLICTGLGVLPASAAPAGFSLSQPYGADGGVSALAYASDGTLYLSEMGSSTLTVISPGGARGALPILGASLVSVGGMCVTPDGATLLITDNKNFGDGQGNLYAVDVSTGQAATLIAGVDAIDDVAVRSSGHVFITDAASVGTGAVCQLVYDPVGQAWQAAPVVTGLDYAAGVGFDPAGNLIYQQATASFAGEVYRLAIAETGGELSFGGAELLAGGLSAAFDLAVDSAGEVFVTGSGGLFELDRDAGGAFTGTASVFDNNGNVWQFATEVAFVAGADAFEPYAGFDAGHLTYVPEFGDQALRDVTAVPAPATLALLSVGAAIAAGRRRRRGRPW